MSFTTQKLITFNAWGLVALSLGFGILRNGGSYFYIYSVSQ